MHMGGLDIVYAEDELLDAGPCHMPTFNLFKPPFQSGCDDSDILLVQ